MLTILISTMAEGIQFLKPAIEFEDPEINYLIVHQEFEGMEIPSYLKNRSDIEIVKTYSKGLAASRNVALKNCKTSYALIADDDVRYIPHGLAQVMEIIEKDKPDFALFKISTHKGEPEYKAYPKQSYELGELLHWVSSIELLVNVDKLKEDSILFDERFGLGTTLDRGEEEIFVKDMLAKKWNGIYYPIYLVMHPYMSSGKIERSLANDYFFRGAFDYRTNDCGRATSELILSLSCKEDQKIAQLSYEKGRHFIDNLSSTILCSFRA